MKFTDDYQAKIKLWALNPKVMPLPPTPRLPKFAPQKFHTHAEMNRWKAKLIRQLAREGSGHG